MKWFVCITILVTIIPPNQKTSENLLFIIDKSSSLDSKVSGEALQQFVNIATGPDPSVETKMCIYKFAKVPVRWKYGWRKLPSKPVINAAQRFLTKDPKAIHYTLICPALVAALREPKKKLSIIIITDGEFSESEKKIQKTIAKWQKWRVLHGHGKAAIGIIGVGTKNDTKMKAIATSDVSLGYYHVRYKKKVKSERKQFK